MKTNKRNIIIIVLYIITVLLFIINIGTHEIKEGNMNFSPCSFSLANIDLYLCILVVFSYAMYFLPFYWRFRSSNLDWKWTIYPCGKSKWSRVLATVFSLWHLLITSLFYLYSIAFSTFFLGRWYVEEDLGLVFSIHAFCCIGCLIVNVCFGLLRPSKYKKVCYNR